MAPKKKTQVVVENKQPVFNPNTDITPLTQTDGQRIQEMVDLNNTFATLDKQMKQFDAAIIMLTKKREQIQSGEISLPVMVQITRTISHAESDKVKVLKHIDDEIIQLQMAKQGVLGSMEHRRDEYAECVLRVHRILGDKIKNYEVQKIVGNRPKATGPNIPQPFINEEKAMLEKELEKLIKKEQ